MKHDHRQRGFTILELIITLAVGMILLAAAYAIYIGQHRGLERIEQYSTSVQSARLTIDQLSRELRMAGFGVVKGEAIVEAKKYSLRYFGDIDTDIAGTLAENVSTGGTEIRVDLDDTRDVVDRSDYLFINGGGNVELLQVRQSGSVVELSEEPDTIYLQTGTANAYTASQTLLRTIESVRYDVQFPGGNLRRNNVLLADGLQDLEFHYYREDGGEMTPDAVNGLSQIERAAVRQVEIRLITAGPTDAAKRTYSEKVELRNMGNRPFKADTCAPSGPTGVLIADSGTCGQFTVNWTAPLTNACDGSALTDLGGYKIFYGDSSGNYFLPAANVAVETETSYTVEDERLTNNTRYYVTMVAYDSSFNESVSTGEISFLLTDTTPPHAPPVADANAGVGAVTLSWSKPDDGDVKGYRIYRSTSPDVPLSIDHRIADETVLDDEATTFVDSAVQPCATYYYKITAVDCVNEGPAAAEVSGDGDGPAADAPRANETSTTPTEAPASPPGAPAPFVAIGRAEAVELMWTNPADADFSGVVIRFSTVNYPSDPNDGQSVGQFGGTPSQALTQTHSGLVDGLRYYYSIFAYDRCGNFSSRTVASAIPSQNNPVVEIYRPVDGATVSNGTLVFQARGYDPDQPGVSEPPSMEIDNGKGISSIRFRVTPDPGTFQFPRTEYIKQYCGFGGDVDPCPAGDITQWCDGTYQLYAVATDDEGQQSASPYVTIYVRNGGLYQDLTYTPVLGGAYYNEIEYRLENNSDSDITIGAFTFTWDKANARLAAIQVPSGTAIWSSTTAPAQSGEKITLPTYGRPTVSSHAVKTIRLAFMQMFTTLAAAATSGQSTIQVQSASGFAVGETIYVVDGATSEAKVISAINGSQFTLSSALANSYNYGAAVRHRAVANDMPMNGATLTAVIDYQKVAFYGRTCASDQMSVGLSPAPVIYEAQQDMPTVNRACSTNQGEIQIENYRAVPVHIKVMDHGGSGLASVKVFYYVDSGFQAVAPTSGYAQLTMTYNGAYTRWEATIPYQSNARVWLYFTTLDNNGETARDPVSTAYSYDYYADTTAPVCPLGLVATKIAKRRIDLSWLANSETDIVGYNIYRKRGSGAFAKVYTRVTDQNSGLPGVQYTDDDNKLNADNYCYTYYVTAVDLQGNESSPCSSYTASAGKSPCP